MKLLPVGVVAVFIVIVIGNTVTAAQPAAKNGGETLMKAPIAKKVPKVLKIHGYEITDNYGWLRDRNDKKDTEIIKYLDAENAFTEAHMGKHKDFADALYKEMLGRIKQTDLSVPMKMGEHWYFNKTEEGKQYPTFLRGRTRDGKDAQLLLDQNELAKG